MTTFKSVRALLALLSLALLLVACASGAKPDSMVADRVEIAHKSSQDVSIAVSGGKETSSMGASQISDAAFAQALTQSIEKVGLFAKVSSGPARYTLTAFIGNVDQPMVGFSLTVKMEVSYTLKDAQSGMTLWTQNIASQHTATTGDAFAAVERLRLANEGAAKENIRQAIEAMAALNLG